MGRMTAYCLRCGHIWYPRQWRPRSCAACRSAYWDRAPRGPSSTPEAEYRRAWLAHDRAGMDAALKKMRAERAERKRARTRARTRV